MKNLTGSCMLHCFREAEECGMGNSNNRVHWQTAAPALAYKHYLLGKSIALAGQCCGIALWFLNETTQTDAGQTVQQGTTDSCSLGTRARHQALTDCNIAFVHARVIRWPLHCMLRALTPHLMAVGSDRLSMRGSWGPGKRLATMLMELAMMV